MSTTITRTPMIDDDGSGLTGTIIDNPWKTELYNQIDGMAATLDANTNANTSAIAATGIQLLRGNNGAYAGTGAGVNLDQCVISGLTAMDFLEIFWTLQSTGSTAVSSAIRWTTDTEAIGNALPSLAAASYGSGHAIMRCGPAGQVGVCNTISEGLIVPGTRFDTFSWVGITKAWTATWNLTFQAITIPSGVSLYYSWNVYRRKGQ
jgi:hypothetical protein